MKSKKKSLFRAEAYDDVEESRRNESRNANVVLVNDFIFCKSAAVDCHDGLGSLCLAHCDGASRSRRLVSGQCAGELVLVCGSAAVRDAFYPQLSIDVAVLFLCATLVRGASVVSCVLVLARLVESGAARQGGRD